MPTLTAKPVKYDDLKKKLVSLYDHRPELYLRDTPELTADELEKYKTALLEGDSFRVKQHFTVHDLGDGRWISINGNSRWRTIEHYMALEPDKYKVSPIPVLVRKSFTDAEIIRLQQQLNNSTRPNSFNKLIENINRYSETLETEGFKPADAVTKICDDYGVTRALVSNAKKLKSLSPELQPVIDNGTLKIKTAVKVIQTAEKYRMPQLEVCQKVRSFMGKEKLTVEDITAWRKHYESSADQNGNLHVVAAEITNNGQADPAQTTPMLIKDYSDVETTTEDTTPPDEEATPPKPKAPEATTERTDNTEPEKPSEPLPNDDEVNEAVFAAIEGCDNSLKMLRVLASLASRGYAPEAQQVKYLLNEAISKIEDSNLKRQIVATL